MPDGLIPDSIAQAAAKLRSGELSCLALAERCLARVGAAQARLNAFVTVTADHALATARERDAELRGGKDRGPLHGIPYGAKDLVARRSRYQRRRRRNAGSSIAVA